MKDIGLTKAQMGAIGEFQVATKLLEHGWDAFLANMSINNCMSYDVICVDNKGRKALVQVKSSVENSFPIGMSIEKTQDKNILEEKIVGAWVFVHIEKNDKDTFSYHYYILSKSEMIQLIQESHRWYINDYKPSYRKKAISQKSPAAISLKWLKSEGEEDDSHHYAFTNPLKESAQDKWEKIFE